MSFPNPRVQASQIGINLLSAGLSTSNLGEAVWETAADAMVISNAAGTVLKVNRAYCQLYGYSREQLVGQSFAIIFSPEQREAAVHQYQRVFTATTIEPRYQATVRLADGTEKLVESRIEFLVERGKRVAMLSIIRDVTEIQQRKLLLEQILTLTPDLICVYDRHTQRYMFIGSTLLSRLGYTEAEIETFGAGGLAMLIHPDDASLRLQGYSAIDSMSDGSVYEHEYRIRAADGSWRWLRSRDVVFARDPGGYARQILCIAQDITAQKETEATSQRFAEQIAETQKLESLGVLASGIAHDFNNLLVAIRGNAELALQELGAETAAKEAVAQTITTSQKAADLCNQLLTYAGKGKVQRERVDMNVLVQEMLDLLHISIGKQVRLQTALSAAPMLVDADATQLRQLVLNLITNAADAIAPKPGTITVTVTDRVLDQAVLSTMSQGWSITPGRYVVLEVADTGVGMDTATRARIFEPFFTTKAAGRGLGLASVLGIIRHHQGGIAITSEQGCGTTFTIALPYTESLHSPPSTPVFVTVPPQRRLRLLVVDDDFAVRSVTAKLLQRLGHHVITASDGTTALNAIQSQSIDTILLDLTMPPPSGGELIELVRQLHPDMPIIVMSGYGSEQAMEQIGPFQPLVFLGKPFGPIDLQRALQAVKNSDLAA
jgi:PAS domain S-box-containing protein